PRTPCSGPKKARWMTDRGRDSPPWPLAWTRSFVDAARLSRHLPLLHSGALREQRSMRRLKRAISLVVYLLAVFLLFEGVARLALSSNAFFQRLVFQDDSSWRLRWIRNHARQSEILYQFDLYHPTRGWAVKPGVRGGSAFPGKMLCTNSRG